MLRSPMTSFRFWLIAGLTLTIILLAGCSGGQPRIQLEADQFDFGDVPYGDVVTHDLAVTNSGSAPLIVEAVSTSCGCTTATLEPMTLEPGEQAILHIEFNSAAHGPESTGLINRQVYLATNDPESADTVIEFTANVLPPANTSSTR